MPKRNPPRDVYAEENVRRRIAIEREARGWSYEGLASRMTAAGIPLNQSAIYKIERGDPPRRVTVDELVGYARVFGLAVDELLADPEMVGEQAVIRRLDDFFRRFEAARQQAAALARSREELRSLVGEIEELAATSDRAAEALARYVKQQMPEGAIPEATCTVEGCDVPAPPGGLCGSHELEKLADALRGEDVR